MDKVGSSPSLFTDHLTMSIAARRVLTVHSTMSVPEAHFKLII
jgi:hypothetical protein